MKVFISVDIEGCAGITHWDEAEKNHADYPEFREQMTREAVAAIEGAKIAGATEILVKDAHSSGRNLIASMLPADVRLVRSWMGHPLCMVQELDERILTVNAELPYSSLFGTLGLGSPDLRLRAQEQAAAYGI